MAGRMTRAEDRWRRGPRTMTRESYGSVPTQGENRKMKDERKDRCWHMRQSSKEAPNLRGAAYAVTLYCGAIVGNLPAPILVASSKSASTHEQTLTRHDDDAATLKSVENREWDTPNALNFTCCGLRTEWSARQEDCERGTWWWSGGIFLVDWAVVGTAQGTLWRSWRHSRDGGVAM